MNVKLNTPSQAIKGTIHLHGSKSISNRVLIIKALSGLDFNINNLSDSDDTQYLQAALENMASKKEPIINVGHAGTDMRFLTALLAIGQYDFELTGSDRIQQRPVKELVEVLQKLGADISYKNQEGYPPLQIKGKKLNGGKITINAGISSQFISALLLIAPYFENGLELTLEKNPVSKPYIDMTIHIMREFGATVHWNQNIISVKPSAYQYKQSEYIVESDWSSASYYYSLVALSKLNTSVSVRGLFQNSTQADSACVSIYQHFGVETAFNSQGVVISKTRLSLDPLFQYDFLNCPDIAQTVACTCLGLKLPFKLNGLQTLKVKETDRILALKNEFFKFGLTIEATLNSLSCEAFPQLSANNKYYIATYNDHRMAMAFAPLCLLFENIIIEDAEVISKSYPGFWNDLKRLGIFLKST